MNEDISKIIIISISKMGFVVWSDNKFKTVSGSFYAIILCVYSGNHLKK